MKASLISHLKYRCHILTFGKDGTLEKVASGAISSNKGEYLYLGQYRLTPGLTIRPTIK